MYIEQIGTIAHGQDGAIYKNYLFRFTSNAKCYVYKITEESGKLDFTPDGEFMLDKHEILMPHSNSVSFGTEFYEAGDEFPLLYTNIYNSYPQKPELCGVCCVYRITRLGGTFATKLVQVLKVDFTDDKSLWRSESEQGDVRPYGNFAIDKKNGQIFAFTMRDKTRTNAYFSFNLPSVKEGEYQKEIDALVYHFTKNDTLTSFEENYTNYMQGAIISENYLYSLEGFTSHKVQIPAIRKIDISKGKEVAYVNLVALGYPIEPEFVDFYGNLCIYGDSDGNLYKIEL